MALGEVGRAAAVSPHAGDLPAGAGGGLPGGVLVDGRPDRRPDRKPGHPPGRRTPERARADPGEVALLAAPDTPLARLLGSGLAPPELEWGGPGWAPRRGGAAPDLPRAALAGLP